MAAVMITKDLLNTVEKRIRAITDAEVREECPDLDKNYAIDVAELYNSIIWGDNLHLMDTIPKEWLTPVHGTTISVANDDDDNSGYRARVNFSSVATYERPSRALNAYSRDIPDPIIHINALWQVSHLPGAKELIQRFNDVKKAKEIRTKYSGICDKVTEFLKRCKSLNEAVKLMPSLKMYVTKDYLDRMERKVERQTAADLRAQELLRGIDQDELMAVGMAAKIQGTIK